MFLSSHGKVLSIFEETLVCLLSVRVIFLYKNAKEMKVKIDFVVFFFILYVYSGGFYLNFSHFLFIFSLFLSLSFSFSIIFYRSLEYEGIFCRQLIEAFGQRDVSIFGNRSESFSETFSVSLYAFHHIAYIFFTFTFTHFSLSFFTQRSSLASKCFFFHDQDDNNYLYSILLYGFFIDKHKFSCTFFRLHNAEPHNASLREVSQSSP